MKRKNIFLLRFPEKQHKCNLIGEKLQKEKNAQVLHKMVNLWFLEKWIGFFTI